MSSTWNRIRRTLGTVLPMSVGVLTLSAGVASAQTVYRLQGSDTLTEVVNNAIAQSHLPFTYENIGSGQGEKDMAQNLCPSSGITGQQISEGIAPMSRNFAQAVLTACPDWQPTETNVLGLDGAVMTGKQYTGTCKNLTVPLANATDPSTASTVVGQISDLAIIMFGYNPAGVSTGTTVECEHPQRLAALNRLISCMALADIDHVFRRDDSSGTQDTIRERLQHNFWCNGKAEGGGAHPNLSNEDLDPIRKACVPAQTGVRKQTRCTYYPTAQTCQAGDADITHPTFGTLKCSQGLIVALSETDDCGTKCKDITMSIGERVALGAFNQTMGMAGRAMVSEEPANHGLTVNTNTFIDNNIRLGQYMFSRRLFLQRALKTDRTPMSTGDTNRDLQEQNLFTWMTNHDNIDPIVKTAGFVTCIPGGGGLCSNPSLAGSGAPKQHIGAETGVDGTTDLGDNSHFCESDHSKAASGVACPSIVTYDQGHKGQGYACNINAECPQVAGCSCVIPAGALSGTCQGATCGTGSLGQ